MQLFFCLDGAGFFVERVASIRGVRWAMSGVIYLHDNLLLMGHRIDLGNTIRGCHGYDFEIGF